MLNILLHEIRIKYYAWKITQQINPIRKAWCSQMDWTLEQENKMKCWGSSYFEKTLPLLRDACHNMEEAIGRLDMAKEYFLKPDSELGLVNYNCALEKCNEYIKIMKRVYKEFEREFRIWSETNCERK